MQLRKKTRHFGFKLHDEHKISHVLIPYLTLPLCLCLQNTYFSFPFLFVRCTVIIYVGGFCKIISGMLCFHLVFFLLETLVFTYFLLNFTMVSLCPTFGGSSPGLRAELIHSVKEQLSLICGCAFVTHPSAFASISVSHGLHSSLPSMLVKGIVFHLPLQKLKHVPPSLL